jgi:hypothetical protein
MAICSDCLTIFHGQAIEAGTAIGHTCHLLKATPLG